VTAPGAWESPITTSLVVAGSVGLSEVRAGEDDVVWAELRPEEAGRVQLVAHRPDGTRRELLPAGFSARTRVHEYGGGAWWLHDDVVVFANWDDQRLYRLEPDADPVPITPEPAVTHGDRYADGCVTPDGEWVMCVRERHGVDGAEAVNELVALPARGGGDAVVLVTGRDFVAAPRLSPDGRWLAWLAWDHPSMPWDDAELWVAAVEVGVLGDGGVRLSGGWRAAGGDGVSVAQPEWSADGRLHFVSDESGWWNLRRLPSAGGAPQTGSEPVAEGTVEMASPAWVFAQSRYVLLADGRALVIVSADGVEQLGVAGPDDATTRLVATPFTALSSLRPYGLGAVVIGASFTSEPVVAVLDVPKGADGATVAEVRPARELGIGSEWWSVPDHVTFATSHGDVAHALFYPPSNPRAVPDEGARPPLVVTIHGGPTSAARSQLSLEVQFWTSRGFAVVDVNYRGSTGYGRPFRDRLRGTWGLSDVDDCLAAARHLAADGRVDGARLAIRGGSAGGFTTLCALTFHDTFAAGCSRYGVTDLSDLAADTHKFESRYLDRLVGPWPEAEDVYRQRSPLFHLDGLDTPLLVLQGLEDEIVPPSQAEALVAALDEKAVPHAYLAFEGEQHGFRRAETIERALGAELYFLGRVFGFDPADELDPVPIAHLPEP
jgi:dipeptidyl aminopeptidase/acylaminoacyl peptidase